MNGDITRATFDPLRHYNSVRMQQGRVQLDADWNEQLDIAAHREQTEIRDVLGHCGAPRHEPGLGIFAAPGDLPEAQQAAAGQLPFRPGDLFISAGRYYVAGNLCENEQPVLVSTQPDLPSDAPVVRVNNNVSPIVPPPPSGVYVVYADAWTRHLTAVEAPQILEPALGGPDTCTRAKTVWQVKLLRVGNSGAAIHCASDLPVWNELIAGPTGRLSARAEPAAVSDEPCIVAPGAGYRRLENQLYRVEVHKSGGLGNATFKWSRDNGSVLTRWEEENGNDLTIVSGGRDQTLGFAAGQWIELTSDSREQLGQPGTLVQLLKAEGKVLTINPDTATGRVDFASFPGNPKIRRWDSPGQVVLDAPAANAGFLPLESGVEVKFSPGTYRTGDYWLIPARTATGDVQWPTDAAQVPLAQAPHGILHHYCRLAIAQFDAGVWTILGDCRSLFPPLTKLTHLYYVSGEGQDALPGQQLPRPLQVGVANGAWPVAGAMVQFRIRAGNGQLQGGGPLGAEVQVATGPDGVAECNWRLDTQTPSQWVEATLVNYDQTLPVRFNASLREIGGPEPGIHIEKVLVSGAPLQNDTPILANMLADGVEIVCDRKLFAGSVKGKPTCFVTLDLPFPVNNFDRDFWGVNAVIGYQPLILGADTAAQDERIQWQPTRATSDWLRNKLFPKLQGLNIRDPVLAHLTVKGNFIWAEENPNLFIDGDAFGFQRPTATNTDITLSTGDDRRGGDLEMWFWVLPPNAPPPPPPPLSIDGILVNPTVLEEGSGEHATGHIKLNQRAPAGGINVLVSSARATVAHVESDRPVRVEEGETESSEFRIVPGRAGVANINAQLPGPGQPQKRMAFTVTPAVIV